MSEQSLPEQSLPEQAARQIQILYADCAVGGPWHIVTDDENLEDDCVAFCVDVVKRRDHWSYNDSDETMRMGPEAITACDKLAELFPKMSVTQRKKALQKARES